MNDLQYIHIGAGYSEMRSDAEMRTHHDKSSACATLCCNFSSRVGEDNSFS